MTSWNKGLTKETHPSLAKTSRTMKKSGLDNFSQWRESMRELGYIKSGYPAFKKDGDLAELTGVILGDGNIETFPRSERLSIFSNSDNLGFIERYASLMEKIFMKKPVLAKKKDAECIKMSLYEKHISERLGILPGARRHRKIEIPEWILSNQEFVVRYLRGLYEAEGSFCIHKPTSTYKLFFTNHNESMLENVFSLLIGLGFHPHKRHCDIQVSRKEEVYRLMELLQFRKY